MPGAVTSKAVVEYLRKQPDGSPLPSLRELQLALGGGSLDTMSRGVREYLKTVSQISARAMPEHFREIGTELTDKLWEAAENSLKEAEERLRAEFEVQTKELNRITDNLEKENTLLAKRVEARDRQIEAFAEKVQAARDAAAREKGKAERLAETVAELKAQIREERAETRRITKELTKEKVKSAAAEAALKTYKERVSAVTDSRGMGIKHS